MAIKEYILSSHKKLQSFFPIQLAKSQPRSVNNKNIFLVGIEQTPDTVQEKGNYSYSLNGVANLLNDKIKQSTSTCSMHGDGQIKLSKLFHELCDAQKLNLVTLTTQKARA